MFTKLVTPLAAITVIAVGAAASAQAQTYRFHQPASKDRDTVLQEITVGPRRTQVTLVLSNSSEETATVCAHGNDDPGAFSLKDLDTGQVWRQRGSTGLKPCTDGAGTLRPGGRRTLRIEFAALPSTARRLQLGENNCEPNPKGDMNYWCFNDIELAPKK